LVNFPTIDGDTSELKHEVNHPKLDVPVIYWSVGHGISLVPPK